jgi:hypothetical protein
VGKNIGEWLKKGKLPKTVSEYGDTPEKIFVTYELLKQQYGASVMKELPFGAVGVFTFTEKLKLGLQELMAGTRSFRTDKISRRDLMALTPEAAEVSGLAYVMEAFKEEAEEILDS